MGSCLTILPDMPPSENTGSRWRTTRGWAKSLLKKDTFSGNAIKSRGGDKSAAIDGGMREGLIVGNGKEDVGSGRFGQAMASHESAVNQPSQVEQ
jgi:hypothetical protein